MKCAINYVRSTLCQIHISGLTKMCNVRLAENQVPRTLLDHLQLKTTCTNRKTTSFNEHIYSLSPNSNNISHERPSVPRVTLVKTSKETETRQTRNPRKHREWPVVMIKLTSYRENQQTMMSLANRIATERLVGKGS